MILYNASRVIGGGEGKLITREEFMFPENCSADRWDDLEGSRAQGECTPLRRMTTGRTDHID